MATYQCPKGHTSTDPDYCSECGALIGQPTVSSETPAPVAASPGAAVCPDCMTPRTPGARFCEVCRYEFDTGKPGMQTSPAPAEQAVESTPPDVASSPPAANAPVVAGVTTSPQATTAATTIADGTPVAAPAQRLNVVVIADPSLVEDEEERKQCPQGEPELIFPLDLDENLVGRRSDAKKIYPEIDISDPGVSHRHLKIVRQANGSFVALELGSANGTTLNGATLKPGLPTPIAAGDELQIGLWTRLRIQGR
jgi:FHA domain